MFAFLLGLRALQTHKCLALVNHFQIFDSTLKNGVKTAKVLETIVSAFIPFTFKIKTKCFFCFCRGKPTQINGRAQAGKEWR